MKAFVAALFSLLVLGAGAQETKAQDIKGPIRLVVPYAPGGGAIDLTARGLQKVMEAKLGVPVIVDNKPGGGTRIGTMNVANSAPDGTSLLVVSAPGWIGYYHSGIFEEKVWEVMTPIAQIAESPYSVITVDAKGTIDSWAKVVAKSKETNKPISGGAPAAGGFTEYAFNQIMQRSGIKGIFVPYAGAGPAKTALLAGEIDIQMESGQAFLGIRSGQTKGIAISTPERFPLAPDIPTYKELAIGDTLPTNAFSVWGPKNMDPKVVQKLADAIKAAAEDKPFLDLIQERNAILVRFTPPDVMRKELKEIDDVWGDRLRSMLKKK